MSSQHENIFILPVEKNVLLKIWLYPEFYAAFTVRVGTGCLGMQSCRMMLKHFCKQKPWIHELWSHNENKLLSNYNCVAVQMQMAYTVSLKWESKHTCRWSMVDKILAIHKCCCFVVVDKPFTYRSGPQAIGMQWFWWILLQFGIIFC